MATSKQIQGRHQIEDVVTKNIRDNAVTGEKLNSNVAGRAITYNEVTNQLDYVGELFVDTEAQLIDAVNSGNVNIRVVAGEYFLSNLNVEKPVRFIGDNKIDTIINLTPSGSINFQPSGTLLVSGLAEINVGSNAGIIALSEITPSGSVETLGWQGAYIVLDDIPYKVNRITSGEAGGNREALLELGDTYSADSFSGKSFKLQYMLDYSSLENITVISSRDDSIDNGIVNVRQVNNFRTDNVEIRNSAPRTKNVNGLMMEEVYLSTIKDLTVIGSKAQIIEDFYQYAATIENVYNTQFIDLNIIDCLSNGIYLDYSSNIIFSGLKEFNVAGTPITMLNSDKVLFSDSYIKTFGIDAQIKSSDYVVVDNVLFNPVKSLDNTLAVTNSNNVFLTNNKFISNSSTNAIFVASGEADISNNTVINSTNGINIGSQGKARITSNTVDTTTTGISIDAAANTGSIVVANTIEATTALSVLNTSNELLGNNIVSGLSTIAAGNEFSVYADILPYDSGVIDLGSYSNPFDNLYVNNVNAKEDINLSGAIRQSGNIITSDSGSIYINGLKIQNQNEALASFVTYEFNSPSTVWNITHNFNTYGCQIQTYDTSGNAFIPVSTEVTSNSGIVIQHLEPLAGVAVVNYETTYIGSFI